MEQKKQKPVQRTEQSVRAAQRRQQIRAENARLRRLREKQKRQAKRRTVKRINKGLLKRLIIMVGVVAAVILSMVIFFRVQHIEIRGAHYYSEAEILQACGVATGDNLLTLSRGRISGSIMAPLKYIDSVKVTRQLPDTLIISVVEGEPKYAVQDSRGDHYLISAQAKVIEQIPPLELGEYTLVDGLKIRTPEIGAELQIQTAAGEESKAKGQLSALKTLLTAIEEAELGRAIASVQIPSSYNLSLWYEDRFLVELGNTNRLDYKLEYLKEVVNRQEAYVTGTVDLTLRDGDKAILLRDE
ncbi:MAG: FtsQ-type POTRA domain-containing protein [Oscillospiraceae bacterium]|nr:FtsQ-type POTRA domain-containing protein [Oscillospiraceae bacterium]